MNAIWNQGKYYFSHISENVMSSGCCVSHLRGWMCDDWNVIHAIRIFMCCVVAVFHSIYVRIVRVHEQFYFLDCTNVQHIHTRLFESTYNVTFLLSDFPGCHSLSFYIFASVLFQGWSILVVFGYFCSFLANICSKEAFLY